MGVKELRSIIDEETDIYWDGWNAAIEAVALVMERYDLKPFANERVRPMKRARL